MRGIVSAGPTGVPAKIGGLHVSLVTAAVLAIAGVTGSAGLIFAAGLTFAAGAFAQEQLVDVPPGEPVLDGPAEQEVRIVRQGDAEVTEFRDGGVLRAVKVKPDVGPVYYLVDTDGDGDLETRTDGPREGLAIPMWIIARW